MQRKCPECLTLLSVTNSQIVYICEDCGCQSLQIAHFTSLTSEILIKRFHTEIQKGLPSEKFHCGECETPMVKAEINTGNRFIELDACQKCELVWFDHQELDDFVVALDTDEKLALPEKIRDSISDLKRVDGKVTPSYMSFRFALDQFSVVTITDTANIPKKPWKWLAALLGLPIESQNRLLHAPRMTYAILAICAISYALQLFDFDNSVQQWGFLANDITRNWGLTLISSTFLHGGFWHLASNMYFLWIFGDNCEDSLGTGSFLSLFFSGQLIGSLFFALGTANPNIPQIGASAAVSALVCYYVVRFPSVQFSKYVLLFFWFKFPVIAYVGIWGLIQVLGSYNQVTHFTEVSYLAHLGGMFAGVLFGLLARNNLIEKRY